MQLSVLGTAVSVRFSHVAPSMDLAKGAIIDFELAGLDEDGS